MSDPVSAARAARENLARGLGALQSPGVPPQLMAVAEPAVDFVRALEPGEAAVMGLRGTLAVRTGDGAIAVERAILDDTEDDDPNAEPIELDRHALAEAVALRVGRVPPGA